MVKQYSKRAATEAAMRADEFLDQGAIGGQRICTRILQAIEPLQRQRASIGEAMHRRSDTVSAGWPGALPDLKFSCERQPPAPQAIAPDGPIRPTLLLGYSRIGRSRKPCRD